VPEGDAVHRTARRLDGALSGKALTRTDFRVPALATTDLSGREVVRTVARGKHLLTRFSGEPAWTLHTHLKMEGSWRLFRPGQRWDRPAHQARVVLETAGQQAVGFTLGIVELVPTDEEQTVVGHLGPDLLGPDWDEAEALRRLREDPDRSVVEALLDQRNLAGIGNMYASELCFVSGVRPTARLAEVPDLPRLVRRARQMLEQNVRRSTPATTGDLREPFWVYRRDHSACRRCAMPIEVAMLGPPGRERAAYWCPRCQA
jgi:endonuclease-8